MSTQKKTPGVYVQEQNAFPNSVVEVATAIPAFIGYTEKARRGTKELHNLPTRIASFAEFEALFGGRPDTKVQLKDDASGVQSVDTTTQFFLHASLRLYFDNGGGPCYIVSVGTYADAIANSKSAGALHGDGLEALRKEPEPTMIVVPDAMLLGSATDSRAVAEQVLQHCGTMQSRIGIFDVYGGYRGRSNDTEDVISGEAGFRSLNSDFLHYGVAYYPWLYTNLLEESDINYSFLTDASKSALATRLGTLADRAYSDPKDLNKKADLKKIITAMGTPEALPLTDEIRKQRLTIHNTLMATLPDYRTLMTDVRAELNVLPPSGGIAGVYARIDNAVGVHKAPANTGINSVERPVVNINHDEQEDLNVPLNGKAINAIRTLPGRGMLIWGARTLDGNSQDWRYVNVRRTIIMLEQSIKNAAQAYVFEPNTSLTWSNVKNMLINFLMNQWKAGVLMGSKPDDAFSVDVGLGSTMTGEDVLDGYMYVVVKVCLVRPAEFIVITFQQLMPKS